MQFSAARPDVIRAINQRWLLKHWRQQRGADRVPQWRGFESQDFSRVADNLSLLEVIGAEGAPRFLIRFHGKTIGQVYGSLDCTGKYLDEVAPAARRSESLAPYRQALDSGCPVYTIHDVTDRKGRLVHYERLLLPYAREGRSVGQILASFEFVCPDGAFEGHALMKSPAAEPLLRLSATIAPHALP